MSVVGHTDRHHDVSDADVEVLVEAFLHPELLQGHLAATLNLLFELASLFGLLLRSSLDATVFKLNLGTHRPSAAEVVAKHNDGVRNIHAPIARRILVAVGIAVAEHIVAVEMVAIHSLAIATDSKARRAHHRVVLRRNRRSKRTHKKCA